MRPSPAKADRKNRIALEVGRAEQATNRCARRRRDPRGGTAVSSTRPTTSAMACFMAADYHFASKPSVPRIGARSCTMPRYGPAAYFGMWWVDFSFSLQMNSIISSSTISCWFTRTVKGLV